MAVPHISILIGFFGVFLLLLPPLLQSDRFPLHCLLHIRIYTARNTAFNTLPIQQQALLAILYRFVLRIFFEADPVETLFFVVAVASLLGGNIPAMQVVVLRSLEIN